MRRICVCKSGHSSRKKALECDKNYVKGYYRRAAAHMALGKQKLALKDYEIVHKVRASISANIIFDHRLLQVLNVHLSLQPFSIEFHGI